MGRVKTLHPWDKQPGEPHQQWRTFCLYKDMEKRSLARLAGMLHKSSSTLEKQSQMYNWRSRAEAWDVELERRANTAQTDKLIDMRKRHISLGLGMQTAGGKELRAWVMKIEKAANEARERAIKNGDNPDKAFHEPVLTVNDLLRLISNGCEIERLNLGQPTAHVEVSDNERALEGLTTDELKLLKTLKTKMNQ